MDLLTPTTRPCYKAVIITTNYLGTVSSKLVSCFESATKLTETLTLAQCYMVCIHTITTTNATLHDRIIGRAKGITYISLPLQHQLSNPQPP